MKSSCSSSNNILNLICRWVLVVIRESEREQQSCGGASPLAPFFATHFTMKRKITSSQVKALSNLIVSIAAVKGQHHQKEIIRSLSAKSHQGICELIFNLKKQTISLPPRKKTKINSFLKSNSKLFDCLLSPKLEYSAKMKKLQRQKGHGFALIANLISMIAPVLIDLFTGKK